MKNNKYGSNDLPDSEKDNTRLLPDEAIIDLPDVQDIPGQEFVKPPRLKEMEDNTISSEDEEGTAVFGIQAARGDSSSEVSGLERFLLEKSSSGNPADQTEKAIREMSLDQTDDEGDPLNEGNITTDHFGEDLDLPESEEIEDDEETKND